MLIDFDLLKTATSTHRKPEVVLGCLDRHLKQKAQLSLTNRALLFCKVVEVLQDVLSENVDKKFTTQVPNYYSAFDSIILLRFYY